MTGDGAAGRGDFAGFGFDWRDTAGVLAALALERRLEVIGPRRLSGSATAGEPPIVVRLPAVLPPIDGGRDQDLGSWLAALPDRLGLELVLLLRAGSAALGLWRDDELLRHKVFKRYVVRGSGRAQRKHLRTKGKSREGSRLRLANAARLLEDVTTRIAAWQRDEGSFDVVHRGCVDRAWAELFATPAPPPFAAQDPRVRRIAMHVHEPDHRELLRVRHELRRGSVECCD